MVQVPWTADYNDTMFSVTLNKAGPIVLVLSQVSRRALRTQIDSDGIRQLDDRYFKGLEGQYEFSLHFRLQKDGEPGYIVRSHGNYLMSRSVSTDLPELEAGTYSLLMKITAKRWGDLPRPEDTVRKYCRSNQEKLLQVGLAYDLAHARGQTWETDQEKVDREARQAKRKAMEKQRQREELREYRYKQWLVQKKQNERNKKRKQKEDEYRRKRESRKATGFTAQPGGTSDGNANAAIVNGISNANAAVEDTSLPRSDASITRELPLRTASNNAVNSQTPLPTFSESAEPGYSTRNPDMPSVQQATETAENASRAPQSDEFEPTSLVGLSEAGLERPPENRGRINAFEAPGPQSANESVDPRTSQADPVKEQQAMFRPASLASIPAPIPVPPVSDQQEVFSPTYYRATEAPSLDENRSRDSYQAPTSTQPFDPQAPVEAPTTPIINEDQQAAESAEAADGDRLLPNATNANQYTQSDNESVMSFDSTIDTDLDLVEMPKEEPAPVAPPLVDDEEDEENAEYANDPWNAVCVVGLRVFSKDPGAEVKVVTPKTGDEWDVKLDLDDPSKGPSELIRPS